MKRQSHGPRENDAVYPGMGHDEQRTARKGADVIVKNGQHPPRQIRKGFAPAGTKSGQVPAPRGVLSGKALFNLPGRQSLPCAQGNFPESPLLQQRQRKGRGRHARCLQTARKVRAEDRGERNAGQAGQPGGRLPAAERCKRNIPLSDKTPFGIGRQCAVAHEENAALRHGSVPGPRARGRKLPCRFPG